MWSSPERGELTMIDERWLADLERTCDMLADPNVDFLKGEHAEQAIIRDDLPRLIAEVRRLRRENERYALAIRDIAFGDLDDDGMARTAQQAWYAATPTDATAGAGHDG